MLQPKIGDERFYHSAENYFWVVESVKRWYHNQYELALESSLLKAENHLNLAVRSGEIGQYPYNEEEKLKISNAFIQSFVQKFRNVVNSGIDGKIFYDIFDKIQDDSTMFKSDINTFEIDVNLAIALHLSETYHDIARPVLALLLSEYQIAIQKGEEEAKRKLVMKDEFDLHVLVKLSRAEIKEKCIEIGLEIMEKILKKTRANLGKRMADKIPEDRLTGSALPFRAVEVTSSLSSMQRSKSATIDPKQCQSNIAVTHRLAQLSCSSLAVSGQQDEINVATNDQSPPEVQTLRLIHQDKHLKQLGAVSALV